MPRSGPRAVRKYSDEFKLTAVRLSQQPGMLVKTVATALEIHPFMLSKWRKDARDGRLRGRAPKAPPPGPAREIAQLQALEKAHALLQEEHELLLLTKEIVRLFTLHHARYGSPRLHRVLQALGWTVSRRRVAQLMRRAGLRAKAVQGYRAKAHIHQLYARHPNRLWGRARCGSATSPFSRSARAGATWLS
jgi:transposase-like protein